LALLDDSSSMPSYENVDSCIDTSINIHSVFEILQNELEQDKDAISTTSGTTLTLIRIMNGKIDSFNVGDSPAFLGRRNGIDGDLELIQLTVDHKPEVEAESGRIKEKGGRIYSKQQQKCSANNLGDDSSAILHQKKCGASSYTKSIMEEPLRVWYECQMNDETKTIGLAMTRSIGDLLAHKVRYAATFSLLLYSQERETE
jgi:serine/threonine protein phosphatase PrpC